MFIQDNHYSLHWHCFKFALGEVKNHFAHWIADAFSPYISTNQTSFPCATQIRHIHKWNHMFKNCLEYRIDSQEWYHQGLKTEFNLERTLLMQYGRANTDTQIMQTTWARKLSKVYLTKWRLTNNICTCSASSLFIFIFSFSFCSASHFKTSIVLFLVFYFNVFMSYLGDETWSWNDHLT